MFPFPRNFVVINFRAQDITSVSIQKISVRRVRPAYMVNGYMASSSTDLGRHSTLCGWTKPCADHIRGSHRTVVVFHCGDNRIA